MGRPYGTPRGARHTKHNPARLALAST
jgi:hypothetical protein